MQFISNKISVGQTKSFEEICQDYLDKKNANVKTASVEEAVKVAEADEAEGSGQLAVEPLHQTGESTNQDSVAGGKNDSDGGAAPTKASDEEGEDSGQPKAEGSEKFTNDPKVDADAATGVEVKEAEAKCDKCECDPCSCKEAKVDEDAEEAKEADSKEEEAETKEAGVKGNCAKCSKPNFLCKCDKGESDDTDTDANNSDKEEKEDKESSANATVKVAFKKIANLTSEEKGRLDKYWKNIYPDAFVDALLADK